MYQPRFTEQAQPVEQLLRKHPHQRGTQTPELVLLDKFVQVDRQQLKDQTKMLPMDECILQS